MSLTSTQRRALVARSHALQPVVSIGRAALRDSVIASVREAFNQRDLLKVRITADNAGECERVAVEVAARVPCEFVKRIGRVVLLYRATPLAADAAAEDRDVE